MPNIYLTDAERLRIQTLGADMALRRVAKNGHALVGAQVHLLVGKWQNGNNPFLSGVCVLRARLHLTAAGVVRVQGPGGTGRVRHADDAEGLANLIIAAEQASPQAARHRDQLATHLGFPSYPALWAYVETQGAIRAGRTMRELVGWKVGSTHDQ